MINVTIGFCYGIPQVDISTNHVYIEIPKGFEFEGSRDTHCLHVLKNVYRGKDARRTWNQHLVKVQGNWDLISQRLMSVCSSEARQSSWWYSY
jgi:hypothetical protein